MPTTFHEVQRFPWPFQAIALLPLPLLGWGLVQQVILGQAWGNNPAPDAALVGMFLVLGVVMPVLFAKVRLETTVDDDGLALRFFPFKATPERYGRDDVASFEAVTYRPLRDYGGWGIRLGPKGWAYNVSGKRGVRITFRDGSTLLVGSQRADELAAALAALR